MISKIKKNRINLFKLKKLKEMIFIESKFDVFLKNNFFLNSQKKNNFSIIINYVRAELF